MKKINWLNHFLEFSVVLIGILIAFQLNTCAANKKDRSLVREHLYNLKEETTTNQFFLEKSIQQAQINDAKVDSLLLLTMQSNNYEQINSLAIDLLNMGYNYFRKNAYNTLIQSGDIRLIKDFELKNNIINLYEYYNWVQGIDEVNIDAYSKNFNPYVMQNLDLLSTKVQDPEVYQSLRFKNAIATYKHFMRIRLAKYHDCQKEMEKFLLYLNELKY